MKTILITLILFAFAPAILAQGSVHKVGMKNAAFH